MQVYESTAGLRPGEPVEGTGKPLNVLLGPGIIGRIYDGIQRPLDDIAKRSGTFIGKGISTMALDLKKKYKEEAKVDAPARWSKLDLVVGILSEVVKK